MDSSDESETGSCGHCGGLFTGAACPSCGQQRTAGLRVLPPLRGRNAVSEHARAVRLVREFKGPTVRDLLAAVEPPNPTLPSGVRSALRAIESGALERADGELSSAIGRLLPGPGARGKTRDWVMPVLIWCWLSLLVLAFVLALRGGG